MKLKTKGILLMRQKKNEILWHFNNEEWNVFGYDSPIFQFHVNSFFFSLNETNFWEDFFQHANRVMSYHCWWWWWWCGAEKISFSSILVLALFIIKLNIYTKKNLNTASKKTLNNECSLNELKETKQKNSENMFQKFFP